MSEKRFIPVKMCDLCKCSAELERLRNENEQLRQSKEILQQEISDTQKILEMLSEKLKGWNDE